MRAFYDNFYALAPNSPVHAEFCERVFGRNLCQHGFADMAQLNRLLEVLTLRADQHVLDLGCGCGMMSEYISDCTGARVTGMDYIPQAIDAAQQRTHPKADRLSFFVGDINALTLPAHTYDAVIAIDTIYFSDNYARTIGELAGSLRPGGQMGIFFSHGRAGWMGPGPFRAETLPADQTPLAEALKVNRLPFSTYDFTQDEYRLAKRRLQVLPELQTRFEAEHLLFVYQNRIDDARGPIEAIDEGLQVRYLYHIQLPNH